MIITEDLAEVVTELVKNLISIDAAKLVTIALRIALQALKQGRRRIAIQY